MLVDVDCQLTDPFSTLEDSFFSYENPNSPYERLHGVEVNKRAL